MLLLGSVFNVRAHENTFDWQRASEGVMIDGTVAYAGCAPLNTLSYSHARRAALLKAQANLTARQYIDVSGEERLLSEQDGRTRYSMSITETTSGYLRPFLVVKDGETSLENIKQVCVLVTEDVELASLQRGLQ